MVHTGTVLAPDFLDLSTVVQCCGEQGLLGLAFAPDYAASGRFYVHFTRQPDGNTVVARFRRSAASRGRPLVALRSEMGRAGGSTAASNLQEHTAELGGTATVGNISSFGVDTAGELYVVSYSRGLDPEDGRPGRDAPPHVAEQGHGQDIVWLMDGLTIQTAAALPTIADLNWEIAGP